MPNWNIKNMSGDVLRLHGVSLDVGQQFLVTSGLSAEMIDAKNRGLLEINPADATFEERQESVGGVKKIVGEEQKPAAPAAAAPKVAPVTTPPVTAATQTPAAAPASGGEKK